MAQGSVENMVVFARNSVEGGISFGLKLELRLGLGLGLRLRLALKFKVRN